MTRLRTYNNRAKAKALSRRQVNYRKQQKLIRLVRKMFWHQRYAFVSIGSNFRDATFTFRNLGKSLNSLHLRQHYGSPTGRLVDNFGPEYIIPNGLSRINREGHTPPPVAFIDTDYSHIEERILSTLEKKQLYAETYGMGDVKVAKLTGQYPNAPIRKRQ